MGKLQFQNQINYIINKISGEKTSEKYSSILLFVNQ